MEPVIELERNYGWDTSQIFRVCYMHSSFFNKILQKVTKVRPKLAGFSSRALATSIEILQIHILFVYAYTCHFDKQKQQVK